MKFKKRNILYAIIIILSLSVLSFCIYNKNEYGNAQFAQVLYTIVIPQGSSVSVIMEGVLYCLPIVFLGIILFVLPLFIDIKIKDKVLFFYKGLYTTLISLGLLIYSFLLLGLPYYVLNEFTYSNFFEDNYVDPNDVEITFPENKKNLIYIFVESFESSYTDVTVDNKKVNIIPNLTILAKDNVNFSMSEVGGFRNYPLASWTAAGITSQLSGVPLRVRFNYSDYNEKFLPNAVMIGDILKENGYNNYYLLGSKANFAAMDNLFKTHGDYDIRDYNYAIKNGLIPEDYYEFWGYEDEKLFEFAKSDLLEISKNNKPFNYTISTIDTHPVDGYLDKSCEKNYDYQYANVIACEDLRLYNFISWVKEQEFYDNTVIVIVGDHISMQTDMEDHINSSTREIYNVFINSDYSDVDTKKDITPFDMFPTTLAALGTQIKGNKLGIGVNLFSSEKSLVEKYGYKTMAREIEKNSKYYYSKFYN